MSPLAYLASRRGAAQDVFMREALEITRAAMLIESCEQRLAPTVGAECWAHLTEIERSPEDPLPVYRLARMCRWYGDLDLWRRAVDVALALPHFSDEQLAARANVKLMLGDWSGWRDRDRLPLAWDGAQDIRDRVLLVVAEGGFGDCIQMLRFVPWLVERARTVVLAVQSEVVSLAWHNFPQVAVLALPEMSRAAPSDLHVRMMSLPALHGTLPPFVPLTAPRPLGLLGGADRRLHVGLCWAGNPLNQMDHREPLSLRTLEPALAHRGIVWHSVQVGARAHESAEYPTMVLPSVPLNTFADTANLVAGLDAVVTVDTALAHLAGSLDIPTILMLPFVSDCRWGLGDATPWYPSMRIVRERAPHDWPSAVDDLTRSLDRLRNS